MIGWSVGLGVRLAFAGGRGGRVRLVMMVGGVSIAVALLLAVSGALPAAAERIDKTAARGVEVVPEAGTRATGVRAALSVGFWRGHQVRILQVELVGPDIVPPLGVPRTPRSGEVFVSPALAAALTGQHRAELAPRLPGAVVGQVSRAGLVGPDELYAVAGVAPGVLDPGAGLSPAFARPVDGSLFASQGAYLDGSGSRREAGPVDELLTILGLAGVGLVVPLLVLVGTSTRLSAASRERRASAMRLVGATARQLRVFGAVEAAVAGTLGTLAGAGLFLALRTPAAALLPLRDGLYGTDVAPPAVVALLILLGIPVLTALAGALALRRAVTSPLGVRRQALAGRANAVLLVPLGAGLVMLLGAYADRAGLRSGAWHGRALLLGGAVLCLIGLAIGAATLSRLSGVLLDRWGPGLASQLAGRRLVTDPAGSARAITGTVLVVVTLGWVVALLPSLSEPGGAQNAELVAALRPQTVVVTLNPDARTDEVAAELRAVPGVSQVASIRHIRMLPPGTPLSENYQYDGAVRIGDQPVRVVVADCGELAQVLRAPLPNCRPDSAQHLTSGYFDASTIASAGRLQALDEQGEPVPGPVLRLPAELTSLSVPAGLTERTDGLSFDGDLLIPPALWPADGRDGWFPNLLVATDGRPGTREAVRARLGPQRTPYPPTTAQEAIILNRSAVDGYTRAALIATLAVVLVGGLSLAVTVADGVRERRRAHSALTAMGTPVRTLRRGVLLQAALPLLLNIGLAVLVTAATSWLFLRMGAPTELPTPPLPWAGYAAIGATALITCLLVNAAALPFVHAATRPDALRVE